MPQAGEHARDASRSASGAALLLWAAADPAPPHHGNILLWQGAAIGEGVRSITEYLDTHADEVRRRYLAWSHDFSEMPVLGRRLCDRFVLADGTSFWWQSLFVEHSTWKQRSLETLLKLIALDLLLEREGPTSLDFAGSDRGVDRVLRILCRSHGVRYTWSRVRPKRPRQPRSLVRSLPRLVQGLMAIVYFLTVRLRLGMAVPLPPGVQAARSGSAGAAGRVVICGPFANHNATSRGGVEFDSRFWGPLPQALVQAGYEVHWLHFFHAHDKVPDAREARNLLQRINEGGAGAHSFVESSLPVGAIVWVLGRWVAIAAESLLVGWCLRRKFAKNPLARYWPVIRDDWAKAFRGFDCVHSLFYGDCFEWALRTAAKFDEGLYLMENQAWERGLARAWHRHGHGRLTGVAHSTVRFWDLRYQCDPRRYGREYGGRLFGPDWVALNGRVAREEYLATCPVREPIAECEALRYLHLVPGNPRDLSELAHGGALRILVLGDYTRERTNAMLQVVTGVLGKPRLTLEILVKPHPQCPIDPLLLQTAGLRIVNDPVADLVSTAHLVLASNTTSAALEAYVSGGRVLVLDDRSGVNYSPLRGMKDVSFIRDADDLLRSIEALEPGTREIPRQTDGFFNNDPSLSGWRRYFSMYQSPEQRNSG